MKPLLLLHGALGSDAQLAALKEALTNKGFFVLSMNFSGHAGKPFQNSFGIEAFADDVLRFLDKNNIDSVDVFGYSMGGYVALFLANMHPSRVGRIVTLGTKFDWSVESAAAEVKKLNPEKILEKVPAFARILEGRHAPLDWKLLMHRTADMMIALGENQILDERKLSSIESQVCVMLGDLDDMADREFSERVARVLPNGSFTLLKDTPHPIEKVNVLVLTDLIANFLKKS